MNSRRKDTHCGNYKNVDKTIYNKLIDKRIREIPTDGIIIKKKALEFAKRIGCYRIQNIRLLVE